jgi:hypothetical protein
MPPGTDMVCYADDTLVLAGGRGWYETQRLAETAVACAVRAIRRPGLNVSPTKSEALGFSDHRTRGAPPPELCVYIDGEEALKFRMTQVLTGHGVFGEYLLKIQREVTISHHCQEEVDTAQHTLERCPAWEEPRRVLRLTIGDRLAPEAIIEAMTRGQ